MWDTCIPHQPARGEGVHSREGHQYKAPLYLKVISSGVPRGGRGGGHGPRAQALKRAPAQLVGRILKVGANFNLFFSFFFFACRFFLLGGNANSGGGGRQCKHWPPGAGDPRHATGH